MEWVRRVLAFVLAVVATSMLGAIAHSQFVATAVSRLGHPVYARRGVRRHNQRRTLAQ